MQYRSSQIRLSHKSFNSSSIAWLHLPWTARPPSHSCWCKPTTAQLNWAGLQAGQIRRSS